MKKGQVYLVGAGCGKGLITLRGLDLIRQADVILYDDLIDEDLLSYAKDSCRLIYMGKRCGRKSASQEEINQKLYELAGQGLSVVRLKGGDPFVFGRGGEEYLYLKERGISCTAVPGVSSCIAVPESVGIPVTHRGSADSFTVITGHRAEGNEVDYSSLADLRGTLIFLMGLGSCREITGQLIKYGKDPETPASIVSRGFTKDEKRIDGTLSDIADKASQAETPAVLVIGKNAAYAFSDGEESLLDRIDPSDAGELKLSPLSGKSVAVLGSLSFTEKVRDQLMDLGCRVDTYPVLKIRKREIRLPDLSRYSHIVFTSSNGVRIFFQMLMDEDRDIREMMSAKFSVIGSGTARTLHSFGIRADLIPDDFTSRSLAEKLVDDIQRKDIYETDFPDKGRKKKDLPGRPARLLILRAREGSRDLNRILEEHGIPYDDPGIYETVIDESQIPKDRDYSYVIFGSSASVRAFFSNVENVDQEKEESRYICIGEVTARTFRSFSKGSIIMADTYTVEGIVRALVRDAGE